MVRLVSPFTGPLPLGAKSSFTLRKTTPARRTGSAGCLAWKQHSRRMMPSRLRIHLREAICLTPVSVRPGRRAVAQENLSLMRGRLRRLCWRYRAGNFPGTRRPCFAGGGATGWPARRCGAICRPAHARALGRCFCQRGGPPIRSRGGWFSRFARAATPPDSVPRRHKPFA
jgi:hypothetical protein